MLTTRAKALLDLAPRLEVATYPDNATRLGFDEGAPVWLISHCGELTGATRAALDPLAKISAYKVCAVRIERFDT